MKIHIESTTKTVVLETSDGKVPARIWEGETESGIHVHCYITRIACDLDADAAQFQRELIEQRPPSAKIVREIPLRLVL